MSPYLDPSRNPGAPGYPSHGIGPHYGVDLAGDKPAGVTATLRRPGGGPAIALQRTSRVVAPERMTVLFATVRDDAEVDDNTGLRVPFQGFSAPFDGYGPGVVVAKGDSGKFHLLAHLGRIDVSALDVVAEGEQVGNMAPHVGAAGSHTHWEVRDHAIDTPSTRAADTVDPMAWAAAGGRNSSAMPWVIALVLYLVTRAR